MSLTPNRERVEHAQAPRTRLHRAVSLRSRAVLLGAQVGIRSLVAAWMAAHERADRIEPEDEPHRQD